MTTAARPTWAPAKGSEDQGGSRMFGPRSGYSSKDAVAHTEMKARQDGQDAAGELEKRDLKKELLEKEAKHFSSKPKLLAAKQLKIQALEHKMQVPGVVDAEFAATGDLVARDADADEDFDALDDADDVGAVNARAAAAAGPSPGDGEASEDGDTDDDTDTDDDDDEAELLAELERIKRERAEAKAKEAADGGDDGALRREAILGGNPLLNQGQAGQADFSIKRRWDDDVVFRNQTRNEPKKQKRFINDTIRSDFHRRFLDRYMK